METANPNLTMADIQRLQYERENFSPIIFTIVLKDRAGLIVDTHECRAFKSEIDSVIQSFRKCGAKWSFLCFGNDVRSAVRTATLSA